MKMNNDKIEKCRICGSDMRYRFNARGYSLYRCNGCTFEQIRISADDNTIEYTQEYFESSKYTYRTALDKEHKRRLKLLKRYVPTRATVLDYGCASGEFVDYASDDYDIYGCDISADAIKTAIDRFDGNKAKFMTLDKLWESDCRYKAVCLWDVIEHIEYPCDVLKKLRDKTEKGGYVIISTPNIGALFARITKSKWPFMTPPEHLGFFTRQSMEYLAEKLGFSICDWQTHGKWANVGFIMYKFNRVSKIKIPSCVVSVFSRGLMGRLHVYVPTGDVQYIVFKRKEEC